MEIKVNFMYPNGLKNPSPVYFKLIDRLKKSINNEELKPIIASLSDAWALKSGYTLDIEETEAETVYNFKHVSLDFCESKDILTFK